MYKNYIKRILDILLSALALTVLSPIIAVLIVLGAIMMKGNPFFTQLRPGKDEKIFRLIKLRTMTCETDAEGNLLPDAQRLNGYGKFLRSTSLDELPELVNILKGDMSIVGPRPLLVKYLPLYNEEQRHRHDIRPGLTGYAQVNGRNAITWEEKFRLDVEYVRNVTFLMDVRIVFGTAVKIIKHEGIAGEADDITLDFKGSAPKEEQEVR